MSRSLFSVFRFPIQRWFLLRSVSIHYISLYNHFTVGWELRVAQNPNRSTLKCSSHLPFCSLFRSCYKRNKWRISNTYSLFVFYLRFEMWLKIGHAYKHREKESKNRIQSNIKSMQTFINLFIYSIKSEYVD